MPRRGNFSRSRPDLDNEIGGRAHGVDVWDSVEAYEQFVQSTLVPAMGKVAVASGLDPSKMDEPKVTITEIHRLVR